MPVIRKLRIVNPYRKHKRKARKAAARRTQRRARRVNTHKVTARRKGRRRQKRNPLGSEVLIMSNPKRKRSRRRRSAKKNPFVSSKRRSRRSRRNPSIKRSRRHRNPAIGGFDATNILKLGGGAAAGSIATRGLTQLALGDNNTGYVGYAANVVTALGLAWAAKKFMGKEVATGVAAGGIAAVILRIYTEHVSQTSPNLVSGLGDVEFSSNGLGDYLQNGAQPGVPFGNGGLWFPPAAALPAASAAATVAPKQSRYSNRFN